MKMNLPNKLTILRTVMIPFFILFLYTDWFHGYDKIIAAVILLRQVLRICWMERLQESTIL